MTFKRADRGFTLIELMITVAIVAILAKVALGAYQDSVLKGKRAQGRTAITELLLQQERYLTQRNCYLAFSSSTSAATALTSCGSTPSFTASTFPFKFYSGDNANSPAYLLSAGACAGSTVLSDCVQVTATPQFPDTVVGSLQATSTGTKSCTGTAASTNPKLCWP